MRGILCPNKCDKVLLALVMFFLSPAWARRGPPPTQQPVKAAIRSMLQEGLDALTARDLSGAEQKLCAAYLETPSPEGLYALAQLALAEGKMLQAQDLMRRFLADPLLEAAPDSPQHREAERVVALPMPPSANLDIQGSRGTVIKLDGRPVGVLPLPEPILATVGEHHIEILAGERSIRDKIRLGSGRIYELRYNLSTRALIINILPGAMVQVAAGELAPADVQHMHNAIDSMLQKERYSALRAHSDAKAVCTEPERCELDQARQLQAEYVLRAQATRRGADWRLSMTLIDVAIGATAANAETDCAGCSVEAASIKLAALTAPLLKKATARPQGKVHLLSEPSGATVTLNGQLLGVTPYQGPMFVGRQTLLFARKRFAPQRAEIEVQENQVTEYQAKLSDLPDEPAPSCPVCPPVQQAPPVRVSPVRLALGIVSLSAGVLMIGLGAPAIAINGFCADAEETPGSLCMNRFETLPTGASLVGIGSAATLAGTLLITVPTRR